MAQRLLGLKLGGLHSLFQHLHSLFAAFCVKINVLEFRWAAIGPLAIALGPPPEFYKTDRPPLGSGALWKEFLWAPSRYGWAPIGAFAIALSPPSEFYKTDRPPLRFGRNSFGRRAAMDGPP